MGAAMRFVAERIGDPDTPPDRCDWRVVDPMGDAVCYCPFNTPRRPTNHTTPEQTAEAIATALTVVSNMAMGLGVRS